MMEFKSRFYIFDEFNDKIAEDFVDWLISMEDFAPRQLEIIINSNGGECFALQSMLDAMNMSPHTLVTFGTGRLFSCALELFIAGDIRMITHDTLCLAHQFSWGNLDKFHELQSWGGAYELEFNRQVEHYATNSNLTKAKVKKDILTPTDVFLTADELIEHGMADVKLQPRARRRPIPRKGKKGSRKAIPVDTKKANRIQQNEPGGGDLS